MAREVGRWNTVRQRETKRRATPPGILAQRQQQTLANEDELRIQPPASPDPKIRQRSENHPDAQNPALSRAHDSQVRNRILRQHRNQMQRNRLMDMPIATPHCALSAEFALIPTAIQYEYTIARVRQRHKRHLDFQTDLLIPGDENKEGNTLPWQARIPTPAGPTIRRLPKEYSSVLRWDESRVFKRKVKTVKTKGYMHLDPKDPGI